MNSHATGLIVARCPRCGYDLKGETTRWEGQCPLRGICPECGLGYEWGDILIPARLHHDGFFETAVCNHRSSFFLTIWRAARPWRFWSWVSILQPISLRRLALVTVFGPLCWHLAIAALAALLVLAAGVGILATGGKDPQFMRQLMTLEVSRSLLPTGSVFGYSGGLELDEVATWILLGVLVYALMPAVMLLLPTTLRTANVQSAHLVRIAAYSLTSLVISIGVVSVFLTVTSIAEWVIEGGPLRSIGRPANPNAATWWSSFAGCPTFIRSWHAAHPRTVTAVPMLAALVLFWGFACGRYLKLPRPWPLAIVMVSLSLLAVLTVVRILFGTDGIATLFGW